MPRKHTTGDNQSGLPKKLQGQIAKAQRDLDREEKMDQAAKKTTVFDGNGGRR